MLMDEYKIKEIGVFGSVVRGDQRKTSDIDILVDFREIPDLLTFVKLANELEDALRRKVDLVHKPAIRAELREHILQEVIYV
ncbi:MAG: nucleotidyltransferase family protein [Ignavibacteriae bacterium]|nr:nucleotidyltransferase family protein [Ignavibacteriota bacterium]